MGAHTKGTAVVKHSCVCRVHADRGIGPVGAIYSHAQCEKSVHFKDFTAIRAAHKLTALQCVLSATIGVNSAIDTQDKKQSSKLEGVSPHCVVSLRHMTRGTEIQPKLGCTFPHQDITSTKAVKLLQVV